jgi:hypothetical protein
MIWRRSVSKTNRKRRLGAALVQEFLLPVLVGAAMPLAIVGIVYLVIECLSS